MQRQPAAPLVALGVLILAATVYLSTNLSGLQRAVLTLRDSLAPSTTTVINKKDPDMKTKTLTLSKVIDGTTYTIDFEWDCTAEDLRRIHGIWKILCDNPPPGE